MNIKEECIHRLEWGKGSKVRSKARKRTTISGKKSLLPPSFLPLFFDFSTAPVSMTFNWQTSSIESRLSSSSSSSFPWLEPSFQSRLSSPTGLYSPLLFFLGFPSVRSIVLLLSRAESQPRVDGVIIIHGRRRSSVTIEDGRWLNNTSLR